MNIHITLVNTCIALLAIALGTGCGRLQAQTPRSKDADPIPLTSSAYRPDLEYFKALNAAGPARDPQIIGLLLSQYLNANQTEAGVQFFKTLISRYDQQLPPPLKGVYLASLGLLRAVHTAKLPLLSRPAWVQETITMMETAKRLSQDQIFFVRWAAGVVYARLPSMFGKRTDAMRELAWARANMDKAPHHGWLRDVYFHLALAHKGEKNDATAQDFLTKSGYASFDQRITFNTRFTVNAQNGFRFSPPMLKEVVSGRVFTLSGFDFADLHFVVSDDRQHLIAIDAGTTPKRVQAAYEHLRRDHPGLPPLTTVFVTHAHWDHIGGHRYYRQLNPHLTMYARENYQQELTRVLNAPRRFRYFFGTDSSRDDILDFRPDHTVATQQTITIGGSTFELIPVSGGETEDALFIHFPAHDVLFVGDFIMPYVGAPFVEEGSVDGLLDALDQVSALRPQHILHGHERLTGIYASTEMLDTLKGQLTWLRDAVVQALHQEGRDRAALHQLNLMPPGLVDTPETHVPFYVLRENMINRLYDQHTGYWQVDLSGMDTLSPREFGDLLVRYFGVSATDLQNAVAQMLEHGDHELAARTLQWTQTHFPHRDAIGTLRQQTFRRLQQRFQDVNPFKFIIYSEVIGDEMPPVQ